MNMVDDLFLVGVNVTSQTSQMDVMYTKLAVALAIILMVLIIKFLSNPKIQTSKA